MGIKFQGRDFFVANPDSFPEVRKQDFSSQMSDDPAHGPPGDYPVVHKQEFTAVGAFEGESVDSCVPVEVSTVVVDPADNPLVISTEYTFSADGLSGTGPYTYAWYLNSVFQTNSETFVYTLVEGDIQNKDDSGLGEIFVYVQVGNACGIDSTDPLGSFPAQGLACVPAEVLGVLVSPADNPLTLGVEYTFSADGASGTAPLSYQWFLNFSLVGSAATFVHTLVDGDVQNKDGSGLGEIFVSVIVSNDCGSDQTNPFGSFPAQGDP